MIDTRKRLSIGAALGAAAVAATATAWACTPEHMGSLSVSPTEASPGDSVTLTASGLKLANAPYDVLYLDPSLPKGVVLPTCALVGQPMITEPKVVLSNASAGFTASAIIPPVTTAGAASICVTLARYSGPPEALIDITVL